MLADDGRVVSNFIVQALRGEPITLMATAARAVPFVVDDLVEGLIRLMNGDVTGPINLGNPHEFTIRQLAEEVRARINPQLPLIESLSPLTTPASASPTSPWPSGSWVGTPIEPGAGLEPTIAWFQELLG